MKISGLSPVAHGAMEALRQFEELRFVPQPVADELVALELAEPKDEALAITPKGRAWRPFDQPAADNDRAAARSR
jgi:hypothetical protein